MLILKGYQSTGIAFLKKQRRAILGDQPGLGKTAQAILASHGKTLVIAPRYISNVWRDEINRWTSRPVYFYNDKEKFLKPNLRRFGINPSTGYKEITKFRITDVPEEGFVITNAYYIDELQSKKWDTIIIDEIHMFLKGRKNQTVLTLKRGFPNNAKCFLLSGTPITALGDEIYTYLNLLYPKEYSSYWRFANEFFHVSSPKRWTQHWTVGDCIAPEALYESVKHLYIGRERTLLKDLPPLYRTKINVRLTGEQENKYIKTQFDYSIDGKVKSMRLRQVLAAPQMEPFNSKTQGIGIQYLKLYREHTKGRIAIFSYFRQAIKYIAQALGTDLTIDGQTSSQKLTKVIDSFKEEEDSTIVISVGVCTGFTLVPCNQAIFHGLPWSFAEIMQSESRLHRLGQKLPCHISYIFHHDTVDDKVYQRLGKKLFTSNNILKTTAKNPVFDKYMTTLL